MRKILLCITLFLAIFGMTGTLEVSAIDYFFSGSHRGDIGIQVDCGGQDCIQAGVEQAGKALNQSGIETKKPISQAVQDLIIKFLTFLSIIAVIYVIGAGAYLIFVSYNDESVTKMRKIIMYVILGIFIIWIAYWIVAFVIETISGAGLGSRSIPKAYAQTQVRNVDFESFANKIKGMKTAIHDTYNPDVITELDTLLDGAYQHLPDSDENFINKNLYEDVKKRIKEYNQWRDTLSRGALELALDDFFNEVYAPKVTGQIVASPITGSAPLSVTLDARKVADESGNVIGENNYIWWMKNAAAGPQILGRGKTINTSFDIQGNYAVFLTINSDSKNSQGFTDVVSFEKSVNIEVTQEDARFFIYFNNQLIGLEDTVKVPTNEAAAGVVIDASTTFIPDGYQIELAEWDFGNGKKSVVEGRPRVEYQTYDEGSYDLRLTLTRNDGVTVEKRMQLVVGDPIADIFATKTNIHRNERVNFKANKLSSQNTNYFWEVRQVGEPSPIFTDQGPTMSYVFTDIGRYSVSLTSEKIDGSRDQDTKQIIVESQPPVARFEYRPVSQQLPNTLIFDATKSYDPDLQDESSLRYTWFVDGRPVTLDNPERNGSRGTYTFTERGTYSITLTIEDGDGKSTSESQDVTIDSTLFLKLNTQPLVAKRGQRVLFATTSSPEAKTFSWDFGDKSVNTTTTGRTTHAYETSGSYDVRVTVSDSFGNKNSLKHTLHVTDADAPLSVMDIQSGSIFSQEDPRGCNGQSAIISDRVSSVHFAGERSVNSSGKNDDLTYFWKVGLNETSSEPHFDYTFDELGCHEISLTVTDKRNGKSHTSSGYVKMQNLAPTFSDMEIQIDNIDVDPMTIRLILNGAEDPDGVIRSYTWYYFTDQDQNPQGFRVTTTPATVFVLPKITGRYKFAVVMEDSNGLKVDSSVTTQEVYSTPDLFVNQNLATPIVTFDVGKKRLVLGEESTFTANVKNALGQEISDRSEYRWDLDGDGFYDMKTEKNTITHTYTLPGEYRPKVKVTHRGVSTPKFATLIVDNRLEPRMEVYTVGNTIVAHNTTTGVYKAVQWKVSGKTISDNTDYVVYTPDSFPVVLELEASDGKQEQSTTQTIEKNFKNKALVTKQNGPLILLVNTSKDPSTPLVNPDEVRLSDPNEQIFFYLAESETDIYRYSIDADVHLDTDLNGGSADDADNRSTASYRTGRPYRVPLNLKHKQTAKISLLDRDEQVIDTHTIDIVLEYIDEPIYEEPTDTQQINLSDEDKLRVAKLTSLIENAPEHQQYELNQFIELLLDEWYDDAARADTLFRMHQYIGENPDLDPNLAAEIQSQIDAIYAEGQDDLDERALARKLISDFIPRTNPDYSSIFGDTNTGEPGWIHQFSDDPVHLQDNINFAERIWKAVSFDASIEDAKRQIIYDQLGVLVGTPLDQIEGENIPEEDDGGKSVLLSVLLWLLYIVGGIIVIGAIVFLVRFLMSRRDDSDSLTKPSSDTSPDPGPEDPVIKEDDSEKHDGPDWLKESNAEELPSPQDSSQNGEKSQDTPDWLKESTDSPTPDTSRAQEPKITSQETPAWLQDTSSTTGDVTKEPIPTQPDEQDKAPEKPSWLEPSNTQETADKTNSTKEEQNTPDWLQNVQTQDEQSPKTKQAGSQQMEAKEESSADTGAPDWLTGDDNTPDLSKGATPGPTTPAPNATSENTTPDWLQQATQESSSPDVSELDAKQEPPKSIPTPDEGRVNNTVNTGKEGTSVAQESLPGSDRRPADEENKKGEIKNESGVSGTAQDTTKNENKRKEGNNVDTGEEANDEGPKTNDGTKASDTSDEKKKKLTAKDGTDLASLPGAFAIVPHSGGDHKLVYLAKDAPKDLIEDNKGRKRGGAYKKKNLKIYDVHVDMKSHPSLRAKDGDALDVWVVNDANEVKRQVQAIKKGKGGGTKFEKPVFLTEQDASSSSKKSESSKKKPKKSSQKNQDTPSKLQQAPSEPLLDGDKVSSDTTQDSSPKIQFAQDTEQKSTVTGEKETKTMKSEQGRVNNDADVPVPLLVDTGEVKNKKGEIKNESEAAGTNQTTQEAVKERSEEKEGNNVDTGEETKSESKEPEIIQTTEENNDGTKAGDGQSQDEDEDLPDWLRGDIDPDATTQFTEDLKKMEEERQAKIQEFEEAQKKEQEEQGGVKSDIDTGEEENKKGEIKNENEEPEAQTTQDAVKEKNVNTSTSLHVDTSEGESKQEELIKTPQTDESSAALTPEETLKAPGGVKKDSQNEESEETKTEEVDQEKQPETLEEKVKSEEGIVNNDVGTPAPLPVDSGEEKNKKGEIKNESDEPETTQTTQTTETIAKEEGKRVETNDKQTENKEDEDLPDWLRGDIDPDATTQFTEDLKKMEEERQAKIKEFEEAQKKEQEEQGGIDGDTNETASPRKPASPDTP